MHNFNQGGGLGLRKYLGARVCLGIIFAVLSAGNLHADFKLEVLADFDAGGKNSNGVLTNTFGAMPDGGLILKSDGSFLGTAFAGGPGGGGTVFQVTTSGVLSTLVSFTAGARDAGGNLTNANGAMPYAGLTLGNDGVFYGTTDFGGSRGNGTVFKLTPDGALTVLVSVEGSLGKKLCALTAGAGGDLYGMTYEGGVGNGGTMFKVNSRGELKSLASFNHAGLAHPNPLTWGDDGCLYSTSANGGANQYGSVFKVTTNGVISVLASFKMTDGAYPNPGLTKGVDGSFYGVTFKGGVPRPGRTESYGTVFRVTTNGGLTALVSFDGVNGARPYGGLVRGRDGKFYGSTNKGGRHDQGTLFHVTADGVLTTLASFDGANGLEPNDLIFGRDGNIYGTTHRGGRYGYGTVFKLVRSESSP